MSLEALILFLPSCFALNMAPGPNNLLSVSNATRYGFLKAILAGIGRLIAFMGMIALAASGLAIILQTSVIVFYGVKIIGACYLFYLAVRLWHSDSSAFASDNGTKNSLPLLIKQEFFVAMGNPKAILISWSGWLWTIAITSQC